MQIIKLLGSTIAAAILFAGCGLADPSGPSVTMTCQENDKGHTVVATNNCDKSTRTAEPFIVEPVIVEVPAE